MSVDPLLSSLLIPLFLFSFCSFLICYIPFFISFFHLSFHLFFMLHLSRLLSSSILSLISSFTPSTFLNSPLVSLPSTLHFLISLLFLSLNFSFVHSYNISFLLFPSPLLFLVPLLCFPSISYSYPFMSCISHLYSIFILFTHISFLNLTSSISHSYFLISSYFFHISHFSNISKFSILNSREFLNSLIMYNLPFSHFHISLHFFHFSLSFFHSISSFFLFPLSPSKSNMFFKP